MKKLKELEEQNKQLLIMNSSKHITASPDRQPDTPPGLDDDADKELENWINEHFPKKNNDDATQNDLPQTIDSDEDEDEDDWDGEGMTEEELNLIQKAKVAAREKCDTPMKSQTALAPKTEQVQPCPTLASGKSDAASAEDEADVLASLRELKAKMIEEVEQRFENLLAEKSLALPPVNFPPPLIPKCISAAATPAPSTATLACVSAVTKVVPTTPAPSVKPAPVSVPTTDPALDIAPASAPICSVAAPASQSLPEKDNLVINTSTHKKEYMKLARAFESQDPSIGSEMASLFSGSLQDQ
jgi:hypothetical protein